jgi:hypothetical protein
MSSPALTRERGLPNACHGTSFDGLGRLDDCGRRAAYVERSGDAAVAFWCHRHAEQRQAELDGECSCELDGSSRAYCARCESRISA